MRRETSVFTDMAAMLDGGRRVEGISRDHFS